MTKGNLSKFNLKVYAYVYKQLFHFPSRAISDAVITTNNFFSNVIRSIRGKCHLDHSHITGDIIGFAHDFCNTAYFEKATIETPFIAHNFFLDLTCFIRLKLTLLLLGVQKN